MLIKETQLFFLIPTLASGGAERQVSYLQKEFSKSIIICIQKTTINYDIDYNRVIFLNKKDDHTRLLKLVQIPLILGRLYQILKPYKKEATLISFMEYCNLLSFILQFFVPFKAILSVRNTLSKHYLEKSILFSLILKIVTYIYKKSNVIVVNSKGSKEDLIKLGIKESKIQIINNMYDLDQIQTQKFEEFNIETKNLFKNPTILCLGRLEDQKGHKHLIEIFGQRKFKNKSTKLIIVGEGGIKNQLLDLCKKLGLTVNDNKISNGITEDVFFIDTVRNPYAFYNAATVFALTSLYEGFPNVLVEAGITGATCIATNCHSGPSELFLEKVIDNINEPMYLSNGVLMPTFDKLDKLEIVYNQWVDTLNYLLINDNIRAEMKENLQETVKKYSIQNLSKEWAYIINN